LTEFAAGIGLPAKQDKLNIYRAVNVVMKDIQFTPLKPDVKIPIILLCLGVFGFIGYLIPTPLRPFYDDYVVRLLDAGVSVALGALVWSAFRLIEPRAFQLNL
jgi:hypothetical protein